MTSTSDVQAGARPVNPPPTGFVTFLFTDIQGSTKLWERFPDTMVGNLARHDAIMREAIGAHRGYVFKTIGDAFCAAFPTPTDGLNAALDAQRALGAAEWGDTGLIRVRMALNSGEPEFRDNDYFGPPVNRVARLLATGHGGQVLLSNAAESGLEPERLPENISLRMLGEVRLKDLSQREPVYQMIAPDLPQVFPKLKMPPRPYTGVLASVVTGIAGLFLYQFVSSGFSTNVFTNPQLLDSLKGTILELSAVNELSLLGMAGLILVTLVAATLIRRSATEYRPGRPAPAAVQFTGQFVSVRSIGFLAGSLLLVLSAFVYQQYLWRVELPIPDDAVGIALTREAAAASISEELEEALFVQGASERIVIRELPVKFDAGDIEKAREMGDRIGARAVVIYRSEEQDDRQQYTAYVVFTDPSVGVTVGTTPVSSDESEAVFQPGGIIIQQSVPVPVLRTASLAQLVDATAGIIAHDEGRHGEAIQLLEDARAADSAGRDIGLIDYYLGSSYWYTSRYDAAVEAYERAIAEFDGRLEAGRIPAQDTLILARAYLDLGRIRLTQDDDAWADEAQGLFESALGLREDLLARQQQLEQPSDIHVTYAQVYAMMADLYRLRGATDEQEHWESRARDEAAAIGTSGDPDDGQLAVQEAAARGLAGDCFGALAATDRALDANPDDLDALILVSTLQLIQGRSDLAEAAIDRAIAARPDAITPRDIAGLTRLWRGISNPTYFEPVYIANAEERYRELLEVNPTNVNAHRQIGDLAKMRSDAYLIDSTAVVIGDEVNTTKSNTLWKLDPDHHNSAVDTLGQAIEEYRIVAYELDPDNLGARMALAALYVERMELLYYYLPVLQEQGDQATVERYLARIGEDMTRVREATDALRADDTTAPRVRVIEAWSHFILAMEYETTRIVIYETDVSDADTTDDERAEAILAEWTAEIDRGLAVIETAPLDGPDEKYAASFVYFKKALIHLFNSETDAAQAPQAMFFSLQAEVRDYYRERSGHNQTLCSDMREVERGDELSASGSYGAAAGAYRAALELNPENPHALHGLADVLFQEGDTAGAIDAARQATDVYPGHALTWARLGLYGLAAGDGQGRDEAYGRFLDIIAERPSQERMALLKQAIADVQELVREQPGLSEAAMDVLPDMRGFLDEISDAGDAYQYPQLYSELGELALLAGDAPTAEELLRQGQERDTHQPLAKVWLALAVLVQGDGADDEMRALTDELNDPIWEEAVSIEAFGRDDLVKLVQAEVAGYLAVHPEHADAVDPLAQELERQTL
ncbi:MAG: tetratricopeptide repeat protein [Chloroflexota bacterium]|nr:tetratricopeptide repeat protein [Chloroflexota bacterium]